MRNSARLGFVLAGLFVSFIVTILLGIIISAITNGNAPGFLGWFFILIPSASATLAWHYAEYIEDWLESES